MLNLLSKVVIALGVVNAAYLNAASPINLGRLPQAAPSLVVLRTEPVTRLGHSATINYRGVTIHGSNRNKTQYLGHGG